MVKILISFFNAINDEQNPDAMPCFCESFCNGLKKAENVVFAIMNSYWNKDFGKIFDKFLQDIKSFNLDLIILFNNVFYDMSKEALR